MLGQKFPDDLDTESGRERPPENGHGAVIRGEEGGRSRPDSFLMLCSGAPWGGKKRRPSEAAAAARDPCILFTIEHLHVKSDYGTAHSRAAHAGIARLREGETIDLQAVVSQFVSPVVSPQLDVHAVPTKEER